jgi:hypothetical protein
VNTPIPYVGSDFADIERDIRGIGETMKLIIGALLLSLFVGFYMGNNQSSSMSFSDFSVTTLVNVIDDTLIGCGKAAETLVAGYQDFMKSNKIVFFFKSSLPPYLPSFTLPLLGSGLIGLLGYSAWRLIR